jgi:ribosome biogenesis GTPase
MLAANVDHAVVAVSLAVDLDLARVEWSLALAWESAKKYTATLTCTDAVWSGPDS